MSGSKYKCAFTNFQNLASCDYCAARLPGTIKRPSSRSPERGRASLAQVEGGGDARESHMIAVDVSELDDDDREFLERWANALEVTVAVLIMRIVQATIDGDQYLANRPEDQ